MNAIGCYEHIVNAVGKKDGEALRKAISDECFSPDQRVSLVRTEPWESYDEHGTKCFYEYGSFQWEEPWPTIFTGSAGKTLRSILEDGSPELLMFLEAPVVVALSPAINDKGVTLTCTNLAGDVIATFGPSDVSIMDILSLQSKLADGAGVATSRVVFTLPDGSNPFDRKDLPALEVPTSFNDMLKSVANERDGTIYQHVQNEAGWDLDWEGHCPCTADRVKDVSAGVDGKLIRSIAEYEGVTCFRSKYPLPKKGATTWRLEVVDGDTDALDVGVCSGSFRQSGSAHGTPYFWGFYITAVIKRGSIIKLVYDADAQTIKAWIDDTLEPHMTKDMSEETCDSIYAVADDDVIYPLAGVWGGYKIRALPF